MSEKLYTIPVNDAFKKQIETKCECPICIMRDEIEKEVIDFTMGPSYMEDDIRAKTDELGFCERHLKMVYEKNNRLGMAIVLSTHLKKINEDITKKQKASASKGLFKKVDNSALIDYIEKIEDTCFVCEKVEARFERYMATVFHLYKNDDEFKKVYKNSRGFCLKHYKELIKLSNKHLSGKSIEEFNEVTNSVFISNMQRVLEDVSWFINKFDYRYQDEPWKESKDSLTRAMNKLNSITS